MSYGPYDTESPVLRAYELKRIKDTLILVVIENRQGVALGFRCYIILNSGRYFRI